MYDQFIREIPDPINKEKAWEWLGKSDLKVEMSTLICATQEQALRTNYPKDNNVKTANSALYRMFGEKGESVDHIVCEYKKLAQREYKRRYENIARIVYWKKIQIRENRKVV